VIEAQIKRGLAAAAAGHTLKFTSSSVGFTLYIPPKHIHHQGFLTKKTQEKKQQFFCTWLFHSGNLL
jgi:hypothetical protein